MTKSINLPLASPLGARYESLTTDPKLVNAFSEQISENEIFVYKRPGFALVSQGSSATARGIFKWKTSIYLVRGGTIYKDGNSLGSVENAGSYRFVPTIGASAVLFLTNGTSGYTVDLSEVLVDVTAAIQATVGTSWLPYCAYLNGYICLVDHSSRLWNSDADNAAVWNASNFILARMESDDPMSLQKHLSYLLVVKEYYTELFYDAANPAGVSPLASVPGAKINYGTVDGRTVCDVGGELMWVGRTREGSVTVILISSVKAQPVSTPAIERLLAAGDYSGDVYSWAAKVAGHRFYGVTIANSNLTLVYDITSKFWYQWETPDGFYLPYAFSTISNGNQVLFQHRTNGDLYELQITSYRDDGVPFPVVIQTPNFDGGTRAYKTLPKMNFVGDQAEASTLKVEYSDDDYQTWVEHGQILDLSTEDPTVTDLGSFKKRAFRFTHVANAPFRAKQIELVLDVGAA